MWLIKNNPPTSLLTTSDSRPTLHVVNGGTDCPSFNCLWHPRGSIVSYLGPCERFVWVSLAVMSSPPVTKFLLLHRYAINILCFNLHSYSSCLRSKCISRVLYVIYKWLWKIQGRRKSPCSTVFLISIISLKKELRNDSFAALNHITYTRRFSSRVISTIKSFLLSTVHLPFVPFLCVTRN